MNPIRAWVEVDGARLPTKIGDSQFSWVLGGPLAAIDPPFPLPDGATLRIEAQQETGEWVTVATFVEHQGVAASAAGLLGKGFQPLGTTDGQIKVQSPEDRNLAFCREYLDKALLSAAERNDVVTEFGVPDGILDGVRYYKGVPITHGAPFGTINVYSRRGRAGVIFVNGTTS